MSQMLGLRLKGEVWLLIDVFHRKHKVEHSSIPHHKYSRKLAPDSRVLSHQLHLNPKQFMLFLWRKILEIF